MHIPLFSFSIPFSILSFFGCNSFDAVDAAHEAWMKKKLPEILEKQAELDRVIRERTQIADQKAKRAKFGLDP